MDGREPKYTIVKGLSTILVMELRDDRNELEPSMALMSSPVFFVTTSAGKPPLVTKAGSLTVQSATLQVTIDPADVADVEPGLYLACFEVTVSGSRYTTEYVYVDVVNRVGQA